MLTSEHKKESSTMIKGLQPRVVELGKIKIGGKAAQARQTQGGKEFRIPEKYDHFVITNLDRDDKGDLRRDDNLMAQLVKKYGSKDGQVRELPIAFLSDDIEDVLLSNYCLYKGRACLALCDGETVTWYVDSTGKSLPEPFSRPCKGEHEDRDRGWRPHGTLCCVIASEDARWGGVYKFRTTSIITIEQLYGSLVHIQGLTGGVLQGVPIRLVVRPMQVAPQGKATTVYVVHAELRGPDLSEIQARAVAFAQTRFQHKREMVAAQHEYQKLLSAPGENETPEEAADVAEEFHPPETTEPDREAHGMTLPPKAAPASTPTPDTRPDAPPPGDAIAQGPPPDTEGVVPPEVQARAHTENMDRLRGIVASGSIGPACDEALAAYTNQNIALDDLMALFAAILKACVSAAEKKTVAAAIKASKIDATALDALRQVYAGGGKP